MRGINDTLQADLAEMQPYAKENRGNRYILCVINIFSKKAHVLPIKDKTGKTVSIALDKILKSFEHPVKFLHTDLGKEIYNKHVQQLLDKRKIKLYSTYTTIKASIVERFIRTLKSALYRHFSLNGNYKYMDFLPIFTNNYNDKKHSTINMKPNEVNPDNEKKLLDTVYNYKHVITPKTLPKYKEGQHVRLSKYKHIFEKGYTPNWTTEIFTIKKVVHTQPITYYLMDYDKNDISGAVYEEEIQPVKYKDIYLVEKIIRRKNEKVFVKWLGFSSLKNSWINETDIL